MAEHVMARAYHRLEPRMGWLSLVLLLSALVIVVSAALEVEWVPEDTAILPVALLGFLFSIWLAHRRLPTWAAWLILALTGAGLTVFFLAHLWPPSDIMRQGNPFVAIYWEQAMALFTDRLGGWYRSATTGGRTTETMGFAFGLVITAWFIAAFLGWTTARWERPAWGLAAAGGAIALTSYFGRAGIYWIVVFVGIATATIAITQYANLEAGWQRRRTDYSSEVRIELMLVAGLAGIVIMSVAYALPAINVRAIAQAFKQQPAVSSAEKTLTRVFAGVQQPRELESVSAGGTVGVLPRAFLLGSAPELLQSTVMTATVTADDAIPNPPPGHHWRATSYDIYTGRGWLRSTERESRLSADELLLLDTDVDTTRVLSGEIQQDVQLAEASRTARYTLGRLVSANRPSVVYWRGVDDLVRSRDEAPTVDGYQARSHVVLPTPEELRQSSLEDVPATILARYTDLPDPIPARVGDLAQEIAGPAAGSLSPYDQAKALEAFLRQYPYSLNVGLPPPAVDMVDYFLFDLQSGFCDYYASAMVVMARSLGLPARLAIGFLPQSPDESGRQILRQVDSHSWAEIYFAGYGWVEFEPTAPIPGQEVAMATMSPPDYVMASFATAAAPIDIPQRAPDRRMPWPLATGIALAITGLAWLWLRRLIGRRRLPPTDLDGIEGAYYKLELQAARLGYPPQPTWTPDEFAGGLTQQMTRLAADDPLPDSISPQIQRLADIYGRHRYRAPDGDTRLTAEAAEAETLWQSIRPELARLISPWHHLRRRLGR